MVNGEQCNSAEIAVFYRLQTTDYRLIAPGFSWFFLRVSACLQPSAFSLQSPGISLEFFLVCLREFKVGREVGEQARKDLVAELGAFEINPCAGSLALDAKLKVDVLDLSLIDGDLAHGWYDYVSEFLTEYKDGVIGERKGQE